MQLDTARARSRYARIQIQLDTVCCEHRTIPVGVCAWVPHLDVCALCAPAPFQRPPCLLCCPSWACAPRVWCFVRPSSCVFEFFSASISVTCPRLACARAPRLCCSSRGTACWLSRRPSCRSSQQPLARGRPVQPSLDCLSTAVAPFSHRPASARRHACTAAARRLAVGPFSHRPASARRHACTAAARRGPSCAGPRAGARCASSRRRLAYAAARCLACTAAAHRSSSRRRPSAFAPPRRRPGDALGRSHAPGWAGSSPHRTWLHRYRRRSYHAGAERGHRRGCAPSHLARSPRLDGLDASAQPRHGAAETFICDIFGAHSAPSPIDGAVIQFEAICEYSSFGYVALGKTQTIDDASAATPVPASAATPM